MLQIYGTIEEADRQQGQTTDLVLICGDFQVSCGLAWPRTVSRRLARRPYAIKQTCNALLSPKSTANLANSTGAHGPPTAFGVYCSQYSYYNGEKQAPYLTIIIGGNHEYYGTSHQKAREFMEEIANDPATQGKVLFLNRATYDIPNSNTTIAGCTLYSHIGQDRTRLTNDFKRTKDWTVDQHNAEHDAEQNWLKRQVSSSGKERQIVIATHYAPTFEKTSHPKHEGSNLNQCFASNALDEVRKCPGAQNVSHWIFGHTHWNARFRRGKTLVVSNQLCSDSGGLSRRQKALRYRLFNISAVIRV